MKKTMATLTWFLVVRTKDIVELLSLSFLTLLDFKVITCSSGLWQSQFMHVSLLHSSKCQTLGNKVYGHLTEAWMMNWQNDWILLNDENQLKEQWSAGWDSARTKRLLIRILTKENESWARNWFVTHSECHRVPQINADCSQGAWRGRGPETGQELVVSFM